MVETRDVGVNEGVSGEVRGKEGLSIQVHTTATRRMSMDWRSEKGHHRGRMSNENEAVMTRAEVRRAPSEREIRNDREEESK